VTHPSYRVLDGPVAGAAAQIALERPGKIGQLIVVERRGGHQEPGRAEAALEALRVQELPLYGVEFAVLGGQALDRGDLAAVGPEGGVEAAVYGLAVHVDRARAAVARAAALLHAEPAALTQIGP
jgi:hypothetical protein